MFLKDIFIDLKGRVTERGDGERWVRERERKGEREIFSSVGSLFDDHNRWDWSELIPGAWSFIKSPPWVIFSYFPMHFSRELD